MMLRFSAVPLFGLFCGAFLVAFVSCPVLADEALPLSRGVAHRSPVDVALSRSGRWLVTANETSDSISLVDVEKAMVLDELKCGAHPANVVWCPNDEQVLVTGTFDGEVTVVEVRDGKLKRTGAIHVGFEPVGVAVHPDGRRAYVSLSASGEVAELSLEKLSIVRRFSVGAWPRYLALSPDGTRLAVGCSGDSKIVVYDTERAEVLFDERLANGINIGHMQCSQDGQYAYFPWMVYRTNPINPGNIRLGWVLASRIGRVRLDESSPREAISLDVPRKAVSDPHGLAISRDERRLVTSASGTHELLVYRRPDLPFIGIGGPGDLIDQRLLDDDDLFFRIDVGGRPMGLAIAGDHRTVFVANYVHDSVQVVDIESRKVVREIALGATPSLSPERRGMAIFYDGQRSLDQWYSCHSCHYNGGINSKPMDTMNDGSPYTVKTVLPLYHLSHTGPWTWHGWQDNLQDAMRKSFTSTLQGPAIAEDDADAVLAFLETLKLPPNPFRDDNGTLTEAAQRGKLVFESRRAGCANCHSGTYFTDGEVHDVGLGSKDDRYQGYNTPSLVGAYRRVRFLHDGRARTLEDVLAGAHAPEKVTREGKLEPDELRDLIEYVKSL